MFSQETITHEYLFLGVPESQPLYICEQDVYICIAGIIHLPILGQFLLRTIYPPIGLSMARVSIMTVVALAFLLSIALYITLVVSRLIL